MLLAAPLFVLGLVFGAGAFAGLILWLFPRTRTAGLVILLLLGTMSLASVGLAVAMAGASTQTSQEAAADPEDVARRQIVSAMLTVTGQSASRPEKLTMVPAFRDERLTERSGCEFPHSGAVEKVSESVVPPLAVRVKNGSCEGWVDRAYLIFP